MPVDTFVADMKRNHVQTIDKYSNGGANKLTVKLDTGGRITYYKFNNGFTVDSMVYNNKGKLVRFYCYGPEGPTGYSELIYDNTDENLYTQYNVDKAGNRKKSMYFTTQKVGDTGMVWTYYPPERKSVSKTYVKDAVEYSIFMDFEGEKMTNRSAPMYTIYDKKRDPVTHNYRVREVGEISYKEDVERVLGATMQYMLRSKKIDTPFLMTIYSDKTDKMTPEDLTALYKKHNIDLPPITGVRELSAQYDYDDANSGRIVKQSSFRGNRIYEYTYNKAGKINEAILIEGNGNIVTKYVYDKNGLLLYTLRKSPDEYKEYYEYTYFSK